MLRASLPNSGVRFAVTPTVARAENGLKHEVDKSRCSFCCNSQQHQAQQEGHQKDNEDTKGFLDCSSLNGSLRNISMR